VAPGARTPVAVLVRRADRADGPRRDSRDSHVAAALGDDLCALRCEVADHMRYGTAVNEALLRAERSAAAA